MSSTCRDFIELLGPELDGPLLAPAVRAGILGHASRLPCTSRVLFECRLAAGQERVDLSQSFLPADSELLNSSLRESMAYSPARSGILKFLAEWADRRSLIGRSVSDLWLEFDLANYLPGPIPTPGVFLNLALEQATDDCNNRATRELADILYLLSGGESYQAQLEQLVTAVEKLPAGTALNYVGLMLSRKPGTLRVQFCGFEPAAAIAFLDCLGYAALPTTAPFAAELAESTFGACVLCIDLQEHSSGRIGLELFPSSLRPGVTLASFLETLKDQGLCTEEKCSALGTWPGYVEPVKQDHPWPDPLLFASLLRPENEFGIVQRRLNHFKLVCEPGKPIEVKAYLAAEHHFMSASERRSVRV